MTVAIRDRLIRGHRQRQPTRHQLGNISPGSLCSCPRVPSLTSRNSKFPAFLFQPFIAKMGDLSDKVAESGNANNTGESLKRDEVKITPAVENNQICDDVVDFDGPEDPQNPLNVSFLKQFLSHH